MKSGIKAKDIEIGSGSEVKEDDKVLVEVHFSLNKGEEIVIFEGHSDNQFLINLKSRDFIPGLRYGIVGMREGGSRELRISPHLAFGDKGIPNRIPPNAVLICKIRLLKITEADFSMPDPYQRKRQIIVSHGGEAARNLPRWHFGIINDGEYGIRVNYPIPDMTWRHTRNRNINGKIEQAEMDCLFEEAAKFPELFQNDIVLYDSAWADMSEPAGNTTRESTSNRTCISITVYSGSKPLATYYVTEDNQQFQNTRLYKLISASLNAAAL